MSADPIARIASALREAIAAWIDRYFTQVLGAGDDYALDVSIESM